LICASHGWINTGMDKLTCPFCKNTLTYSGTRAAQLDDSNSALTAFATQLRTGHHERCPWAHAQADCSVLVAFPTAPPAPIWQAFVERLTQLCQVDALPTVSSKGLAKLAQQRFPQLLTLLDASAVPVQVRSAHGGVRVRMSTCIRGVTVLWVLLSAMCSNL
jgi:C3HC zinc finger-like